MVNFALHVDLGEKISAIKWFEPQSFKVMLGMSFFDMFAPEDSATVRSLLEQCASGKMIHHHGLRLKDFKSSVLLTLYLHEVDGERMVLGVEETQKPLTVKNPTERDLTETETHIRKLTMAVEQSPVSIVITNTEGKIEYANPKACQMTGYTFDELIDQNPNVLKTGTTTDAEYAALWRTISQGNEWRGVFQNKRKNGDTYWESALISSVKDAKGEITNYLAIKEDITERRETEEQLRLFRAISDQADYGNAIVTLDGTLIYVNEAFSKMHGWAEHELIGQPLTILHNEQQMEKVRVLLHQIKQHGGFLTEEVGHVKKDGTPFPTLMSAKLILDGNKIPRYMSATMVDITEMKEKELELRKLNLAIEQSPVAIVITDLGAMISYVSPAFEKITGYSAAEVLGKNTRILQSGKTKPETYESLWNTIESGNTWRGEWVNKRKNGEDYWESISITPIYNELGIKTNYLAVKEDITQRKKMDRKLSENSWRAQKQRTAISELVLDETMIAGETSAALEKIVMRSAKALQVDQVSIWMFSESKDQLTCLASGGSEQFRHSTGYVLRESEIPQYFNALKKDSRVYADHAQEDIRTSKFSEKILKSWGVTSILDTGIFMEGDLVGVVYFEHGGEPRKWYSDEKIFTETIGSLVAQVLTNDKRKNIEKSLRQSEIQFKTLFMESPISTTIIDSETGAILEANPAAYRIRGLTTKEEMDAFSIGHEEPYTMEKAKEWINKALNEGVQQFEWKSEKKNGDPLWLNISLASFEVGELKRVLSSSVDITDQKRIEDERIARKAAEEANRAKGVFLSNMSHEIRTPLNAIIGFSQLLKRDETLQPKQQEQVRTIFRSGEHLLSLVNEILDLSKVEAGHLKIFNSEFSMETLLKDLESIFSLQIKEKGLKFDIIKDDNVPLFVIADEGKLRQVLINLIGNAVKFTQTGTITLRIWTESNPRVSPEEIYHFEKNRRLMFEVEDTGLGIDDRDQELIFEPFRQSERSNISGGTGLGLTISKKVVELMGGTITVESQVGKGSIFRFFVLVNITDRKENSAMADQGLENVVGIKSPAETFKVLLVDDVEENRILLRDLLVPIGFQIQEAKNGQEALDLFEIWQPHAILMDVRIPIIDGLEVTRRIKKNAMGQKTLIIALTSSGYGIDGDEFMDAGIDLFLSKPFRIDELLKCLSHLPGLVYIFKEDTKKTKMKGLSQPITKELMASLPVILREKMYNYTLLGDNVSLRALISEIEKINPELGQGLMNIAKNYDYDTLNELLSLK